MKEIHIIKYGKCSSRAKIRGIITDLNVLQDGRYGVLTIEIAEFDKDEVNDLPVFDVNNLEDENLGLSDDENLLYVAKNGVTKLIYPLSGVTVLL